MATLDRNIQTNAGTKLWATTLSGENKIIYVKAELYAKKVSNLTDEQLADLTSVDTPLLKCNLAVTDMSDQNIRLSAEFTNETLQHDIAFNSIGWFASTVVDQAQGKDPVLFAVSEIDTESNLIAPTENSSTSFFLAQLVMGISNTNNVQLIAGTTGFVKFPDLEQRILELSNQGLIDLGNKLSQDSSVLDLHNTSLHYVPAGTVKGLPVTEDKDNLGGFLISMGNGATTQDGVQIYFEPFTHKTFISYFLKAKNEWSQWIEVGSQSYTKEEIDKMIAKYATQGDLKDATKNLIDFITEFKAFNSSSVTTIQDTTFSLDTDKSKQIGIIRFINCQLDTRKANANVKFNPTRESETYLEIPPTDLVNELGKRSGWIINIPVDDGKNYIYQYVIAVDGNVKNSDFYFFAGTRIFCRYIPINIPVNAASQYPFTEITIDPLTTANSAYNASRFASTKLKNLYDYTGFPPQRQLISKKTIDLDDITFLSDIGIRRFDKCNLTSAAMMPPYDQDMNVPNDLLSVNGSNLLSGWIILLPTNSDDHNTSAPINPLQIVICYEREVYDHPEVNRNMEIYYRFFNTNNPKSTTNFFHKFVTKDDSLRVELGRKSFNFNDMKYTTEGETNLYQVMRNADDAKSIGLPAVFDLYTYSCSIGNTAASFHPEQVPFSYKILSQRDAYTILTNVEIYQEIKCVGFIFYRTGITAVDYETKLAHTEFGEWRLKGNYNPISEYENDYINSSSASHVMNAFILPSDVSADYVGLTPYSDYKFAQSNIKFLPQGTYYLMAGLNKDGLPESNLNGYLRAFSTAGLRVQLVTYYSGGGTRNYIRSGGPNSIGQWLKIGDF